MANIIINNKQYNNVPSVTFDKVGGGTATYTEGGGSGVTIVELDVTAAGTYNAPIDTAYNPVVVPNGTEGTPVATKGTVSSNSITVTPSVTNTSGFISGGTHTGTGVTVSASELVSGTKSITGAGTTDVTNYANASVPAGSVVLDDVYLDESDLEMSASVDSSGLVTYSVGYQGYTDATLTSGYVSNYTSGGLEVTASGTYQLPTQAATTITPTTSSQTAVASGKFTTGAITVNPIPSQYIIPAGTVSITSNGTVDVTQYASANVAVPATPTSYLGTNPVKIADYTGEKVYLSSTAFTTWTPSTTALVLSTTANAGTAVLDLANYDYCIIWTSESVFSYNASSANTSKTIKQSHSIYQGIYKSPNSLTALYAKNYNANRCTNLFSGGLIDYYNANSAHTITYTVATALYPTSTAATFSNSTSDTPTMTVKTPVFRIVCNNTYLSAASAGNIDASNTYYKYWGELWRVDKDSTILGMYKNIVNAYNS